MDKFASHAAERRLFYLYTQLGIYVMSLAFAVCHVIDINSVSRELVSIVGFESNCHSKSGFSLQIIPSKHL